MNATLLKLLLIALNTPQHELNRLALYANGKTLGMNGSFWKGRKGKNGDMTGVISALVQNDQIGPAINRIVNGQLDKDPEWQAMNGPVTLLATTAEIPEGQIQKVEHSNDVDAMTDWHSEARVLDAARQAAHTYQWAGRMVGRVYVPDAYRDTIEKKLNWTLDDALQLVHVQAVDPRDGGPLIDGHGRTLGYYFSYQVRDELTRTTIKFVELHTPEEVQVFKRVGTQGFLPAGEAVDNPMHNPGIIGSRRHEYLMWHADRLGGTAITDSARDSQDRLNVAETYFGRNDDMFGFRMIVTGNAEEPVDAAGRKATWKAGPDVVISMLGIPKDDRHNPETGGRETPTFQVIEPLDPTIHGIPSVNHWEKNVLKAFDQSWVGDVELAVSGESKRVTRKPFDKRVIFASVDTGAFLAWALRAALKLAASIVSEAELKRVADMRFRPRMYLEVDSQNLEEYKVKLSAWKDGALDLESVLESTPGVTDVSSVKARVQAEQTAKPEVKDGAPA